ncbi:MAG: hypothetical protein HQK86_00580 [Nitrospinae bacterium]|nr:hypothetical protein [Nitrospinota bacterium]
MIWIINYAHRIKSHRICFLALRLGEITIDDFFLTAFDPKDTPGGSVDPLGFDRSSGFLADKILPDITNVASQPRYFAMLCAGLALVQDTGNGQQSIRKRQDSLLRLERLWALAITLADLETKSDDSATRFNSFGVRGVTYAQAEALRVVGREYVGHDYRLLSRQASHGALGVYASVAERLRLFNNRKNLTLTNDLGLPLGEAFIRETNMPKAVKDVVGGGSEKVSRRDLTDWGLRARLLEGTAGAEERRLLQEAFNFNQIRKRTAELLRQRPYKNGETEFDRLTRIKQNIGNRNKDLKEAIVSIVRYEKCYKHALFILNRLIWLCGQWGRLADDIIGTDEILKRTGANVRVVVDAFLAHISNLDTEHMSRGMEKIEDIRRLFELMRDASSDTVELARVIQHRHEDVQRGKYDNGRSKAPWVERTEAGFALNNAAPKSFTAEPVETDTIIPHSYRTGTADGFYKV